MSDSLSPATGSRSPRARRLATDFQSLQNLATKSRVFRLAIGHRGEEGLPEAYHLIFNGPSFVANLMVNPIQVTIAHEHEVRVVLGPNYPRQMPLLTWMTPIFHPNIAPSGAVCLGGYSSHWVPNLMLDRLCEMLWDMLCFRNFNLESPYHRLAAEWLHKHNDRPLPLEPRPLLHADWKREGTIVHVSPKPTVQPIQPDVTFFD